MTDGFDRALDGAGIATTVVEAMHLGRHGIGVEYEARWVRLAADNIRLATAQGASGTGEVAGGELAAPACSDSARVARANRARGDLPAVWAVHPRPRPHPRSSPGQGPKDPPPLRRRRDQPRLPAPRRTRRRLHP